MRSGRKATAVTKRLTALFLAAIMTCGAMPLSVFAGEDPAPQDMVLEQPADGQDFSVSPGTDIQTGTIETDSSQTVQESADQDPAAGGTALPSEQEPPVTEPVETPDNGSGTDNGSGSDAQGTDDTGTGEQNPSGDSGITDTPVQTGDIPEETLEEAVVKESEQENDDVSAAAFDQAAAMGNASVSVRAGAGAFPAEAMLSVRTLSQEEQALADAAAAEARAAQGTDTEPAASYSYSVEILHPEGYALQPEAGIPAEIIFTLPEAADEKLTAEVYSLAFDPADGKLKAEKKDCSLNRQEQKVTIQTNTITWYTVVFVPTETNSKSVDTDVQITGVSLTKNIVGDVFINMLNASEDPELEAKREASLAQYPLEHHDSVAYYGDSPRVRIIEGGDEEGPNYLVYRDSYLLISQEDSANYTVTSSEDGLTAYITPALSAEQVQGKTGVVFLAEDVSLDNILVFAGEPVIDGDTMTVSLKRTEDIMVNELFSDGKLVPEQQGRKRLLRAAIPDIDWTKNPKGTNWSGEIKSFKPSWPDPHYKINVWDLLFELGLNLTFDMDFHIRTTGSTNGKTESVEIAHIGIPVKTVFEIALDYSLQVKFDKTPIDVEGTMTTNFDINIGTHGPSVKNYRTPVKISKLTVDPENTLPDRDKYNKEINFYIGSELSADAKVLYLKINLKVFTVKLGPVLKLKIATHGGCDIKAKHEKDTYTAPIDLTSPDEIHTCTATGQDGCQSIHATEKNKMYVKVTLDLYFDSWSWDPYDPDERIIDERDYYHSLTFDRNGAMVEGVCPHRFYKVPAAVWLDTDKTIPAPAGMDVTVSDSLNVAEGEKSFISAKTDENGKAVLFLPYKRNHRYTLIANGVIDNRSLTGSESQRIYMQAGANDQVDIILKSDENVIVKTNIIWNVDVDKKEVPGGDSTLRLALYRREAGTDNSWGGPYDYVDRTKNTDKAHNWSVENWVVPKYGFDNTGRAFLYEYRVRILEKNSELYGYFDPNEHVVITPEKNNCIIQRSVDAYDNAVGATEQSHATNYYIDYSDVVEETAEADTEDTIATTTITGTAVMDVQLKKHWKLTDPKNKAESVYLALEQKPEFGWEDKAEEMNVPVSWTTVLNPFNGPVSSLKSLDNEGVIFTWDNISLIENVPLAIGKVHNGNGWSVSYRVPKFRNGIKMQFEGCEIDSEVIESLLSNEYDLDIHVSVDLPGEYYSFAGIAADVDDTSKLANVVNVDLPDENVLMGTVWWQYYFDLFDVIDPAVPEYVDIHVKKDGTEVASVRLNKADHLDSDTWIWTLTLDDYDPDANYTVTETFPTDRDAMEWVPVVEGLNVYNYRIWYDSVQCEAQAVFEDEPADLDELAVYVREKGTNSREWNFSLEKGNAWWDRAVGKNKYQVKPVSGYELVAPDVPGYVKVYGEPYAYTRPGWGNLFYNFTVYYVHQSNALNLHVTKEWDNTDETTAYPEDVTFEVYRNDKKIAERTLTPGEDADGWSSTDAIISAVISEDEDHRPLSRLDASNHRYVYTIREKEIEGFSSKVVMTKDDGDHIYYTLKNTWVGPDYVHVKGTVKWEGDTEKEYLRPDTVKLSVVNSKEEYVKTVEVPVEVEESGEGEKNWTWETKYLPGKDSDGNTLTYSVMESHVKGYSTTYDEPVYDEATHTWTCDVTNKLTGYFPLTIKKVIEGEPGENDEYTFTVASKDEEDGTDREIPLPVNNDKLTIKAAGDKPKEVTAEFLIDEDGLYLYSVKENKGDSENCTYDDTEKVVLIVRTTEKNEEGETEVKFSSWVADAEEESSSDGDDASVEGTPEEVDPEDVTLPTEENEDPSDPSAQTDYEESNTVEFVNVYSNVKITKKWNIDLLGKDKPDSIEAVVQTKKDGKWENVRLVELNSKNDWTASVSVSGSEFRVRELKEEEKGLFKDLLDTLKGKVTGYLDDEYGEVLNTIKGSEYYGYLPEVVQNAAEQGADKLKEQLNATSGNLFDKLVEQLGLAALLGSDEDRVVYDEDDDDKPTGEDAETNMVSYSVGDDETKYRVKYDEGGSEYTITNTAVLDIDVIKRWAAFGVDNDGLHVSVDDEDMPDSAWVVLMFNLNPEELAGEQVSNMASEAGFDLSGLSNYELPVFTLGADIPFLLEGGSNPISIISELAIGIDLGFLDKLIPVKMAIAKVDKDSDWRKHYVVGKYAFGVPVEFKGAELSSEVIRQIVKYLSGGTINLKLSYNPFDNYFSIPTKAVPSILGMKDPGELLDFSGLMGKLWEKAKSLTLNDLKNIGIDTVLDGTDLMANVINIKIDFDISGDQILVKDWVGDKEEDRPDYIDVYLKDGDKELEEPVRLEKENFEGKDVWMYDLSELDKEEDEDGDSSEGDENENEDEEKPEHSYTIVREEYPDDYEHKDDYGCKIEELTLTNTWIDPEKVTISGKKIWEDDDDQDGIRPEKVTLRLLSSVGGEDPEPVKVTVKEKDEDGNETEKEVELTVETSKEGNWEYVFPPQPRYKKAADDNSGDNDEDSENGQNSGNDSEEKQEITYTVEEVKTDVITGEDGEKTYAISYADPVEDEAKNLTIDVTNTHTTQKLTVEKKWVDKDGKETDEWKPESVKVVLQHKKSAETETPAPGNTQENGNSTEVLDGSGTGETQETGETGETQNTGTETWETVGDPVELNDANEWKAEFKAKGLTESTAADWRIRELGPDGKVIFAEGDEDKPEDAKNEIVINVKKDDKNNDVPYVVSYEFTKEDSEDNDEEADGENDEETSADTHTIITNKLNGKQITVEKSWDIDLEKNDKPDSIEAVIQEKKDDKWETVALVELNGDNSWKESRFLPAERDGNEIEYRARELREETALETVVKNLKEIISSAVTGNYDEIIGQVKASAGSYYDALPESIKSAADQGSDKLKDELKTTTENLYDKLLEKIGIAASENRIVYDKDDSDNPKDDSKKDDGKKDGGSSEDSGDEGGKEKENKAETNAVTYHVGEHTSAVSGGTVDAHETKYRVKYEKDGDTCKITNKAILEIDVIKRWLTFGVEDEDMPDAAWVVLMFKLAADKNSEAVQGAASTAGVDLSSLVDYEFPVFNLGALAEETPFLLEEGQDPLSIISQLTIGIDLDIFSGVLPKMAIARVTKDDNWRVHYVVSKYALGLPVEFKGAELGSEIIRQIIKYVTGLDIPVSYNPFDNYISVPTKAIRTILGMEDLDDLSKLPQAALDKIKGMTMEDWKSLSPETALDDDHLMANVINIKIDWDTDEDNTIHGTKTWKDDKEENRPDTLIIHIKDGKEEIEGSPITLNKSDFEEKDEWTWELDLDGDKEGEGDGGDDKDSGKEEKKIDPANLTVTEEYPEDYEYADKYTCEIDDLDITNTWHDKEPETINISGKKIWEDDEDKDGIRPEKITVKLLADGEEVKSVETSKEGEWKYHFTDLPKYKEASEDENTENTESGGNDAGGNKADDENGGDEKKEIEYTIEEVEVEGYESEVDGYNLINTHESETITIEGIKVWDDAENQDGKRPESITIRLKADGKEVDSVEVTEGDEDGDWAFAFEDQPKTNGGKDIVYTITEDTVEDYTTEIDGDAEEGFTVTNSYEPGKTQIQVSKAWDDKKDQDGIRPDSVTIKLLAGGEPVKDEEDNPITLELTEDENWTGTFEDLDASKDGAEITYTVEEETDDVITGEDGEGTYSFNVSGDAQKGFTVTNKHTPETVTVEGKKTWEDEEDQDRKRPTSIVIRLKAGGEEIKNRTITESSDWTWSFDGLPKYADGEEIEYTISEDNIPDYTSEIDEFDVTNTYTPGKTQVEVTKVWKDEDDCDGIRPNSVTINLLADGEPAEDGDGNQVSLVLSEGNNWTDSFKDLDEKKDGKEIVYTVEEEETDVITGEDGEGTYASAVSGNAGKGFTVTNTHTPDTITIEGKKVWEDEKDKDGKRPESITIRLKADGEEVNSVEVQEDEGGNWTWSFEDLPKKKEGKEITYTITEDVVEDYTTKVDGDAENGFTVTNTYTPGKTQVNVSKVWNDKDDQDSIRPASVTISLLADGEKTDKTLVLSEGSSWSGSFTDLDAMQDGKPVSYTVEEQLTEVITGTDGPGTYGTETAGDIEKGFTVTNTHTPETLSIEGTKVWDDADNNDGKRPESITVRLKANGKDVVVKTVTADEDWKWSYENLPKYDGKEEITYTLTEDAVPDYTTEVKGSQKAGFTVTNTYNPGRTQVNVTKAWSDENDHDGIRPESVEVSLLTDGAPAEDGQGNKVTLILDETNNWTGTFEDLPAMKDGKQIRYTVEETLTDVITGTDGAQTYAVNVAGTAAKGFTVSNTHTPQTIRIEVNKIWDDTDDQDGKRPESVTVNLMSGDAPVLDEKEEPMTLTLSEENGWADVFDGLDKKKDGKPVEYTVEEQKTNVITGVDGPGTYAVDVKESGETDKGFTVTVTNTHTPEMITVNGKKVWDDADNQDGKRPESITIRLKADNKEVESKEITDADADETGNVWTWSFEDLPKYVGGKEIVYTISEDAVTDYTSTTEGDAKTGFTVTNSYTPGKTQVKVTKAWEDNNDQDGIRPKEVVVKLLADKEPVKDKELVLSKDNSWSGEFTDLPAMKSGKKIEYTIEEVSVEEYKSVITGDAEKGFTITNTYTPAKTEVTVVKEWEDMNNLDGIRPKEVEVKLLADGKETGKTIRLSADNDWMGSFAELDEKAGGSTINYTVQEVTDKVITGEDTETTYAFKVTGSQNQYKITNTHTPLRRITYKLNGGTYNGSPNDIVETYPYGTTIKIHEAPVRSGYTFLYWKGSQYDPGDPYTVTENHTFVAQWKQNEKTVTPVPSVPVNPVNPVNPGNTTSTLVGAKTGDSSHMAAWLVLLLAAAGALTGLGVYRKRRTSGK